MRKVKLNLQDIITLVASLKGQEVNMKVSRGRNRYDKYIGKIESCYPSVFTVDVKEPKHIGRISYSYSDVLCGDVSLKMLSGGMSESQKIK